MWLCGLAGVGCDVRPAPVQAPGSVVDPIVEVSTVAARRGAVVQRVSAPGSLLARRESRIGAEVTGRIERVFVSEGDRVEADALLFQIDPEPYRVALRRAEAGLDLARAERRQIEVDLARTRALHEREVVSTREIDRLVTSLSVAEARERQAAQGVALARQDLARTQVRAPYAGSVAERLADEGTTALVQPQTIVIVLQETALLEAHATIPESQLQHIRIGDEALLHVEGLPDPIRTRVSAVGDTIDPATRTFFVKMQVRNVDHRLKAGVFAHVEIVPRPRQDAILVPREAIRTEDGRTRVLAVRDGRAVALPVSLGVVSETAAEIVQGIDEGEAVIVGEAAASIAPGMRVRVAAGSQPS